MDSILIAPETTQITATTRSFLQSPQLAGMDLSEAPTCGRSEKRYCYILEILAQDLVSGRYTIFDEGKDRLAAMWDFVTITQTGPWLQTLAGRAISGHMLIKNPELDHELLLNEYIGNRNGMIAINGLLFLAAVVPESENKYRITRPVVSHWQERLMRHFVESLIKVERNQG